MQYRTMPSSGMVSRRVASSLMKMMLYKQMGMTQMRNTIKRRTMTLVVRLRRS